VAYAFRNSVDYNQQMLYLSPTLALMKEAGKDDAGQDRYWYRFIEASEGPPSDYASVTGDRIIAVLVENPIRFMVGKEYVIGEFSDYDWAKKMPTVVPFAIRLDSNQVIKGEAANELLKKVLSTANMKSEAALQPVQVAFDKYMIEYLRKNESTGKPKGATSF